MKLSQALALVQQRGDKARKRRIFLVCGFQPLHLATFLGAHVAERFSGEGVDVQTGLYGDFEGTLSAAAASGAEAAAVVIEWPDLDPRLGLRSASGWNVSVQADILQSCRERFARTLGAIEILAASMPVALVPPTLPLTLFGHTAGWQSSANELDLFGQAAAFAAEASRIPGVAVVSATALARMSPETSRLDATMELRAGFPYTLSHADAVASLITRLWFPPGPMKGLITDLDDTFWSGILGEVGVSGVCWGLSEHAQIHGLYQQMLCHLSEIGVLLAVASKNDPDLVASALGRGDLLIPAKSLFPVSANWGPKSESVAAILQAWNIGAESVVFVDDSAMELEEVRTAFPQITCLQFSKKDPSKTLELLERLRDLFGKPVIQKEDALRQASIRANAEVRAAGTTSSEFLSGLRGTVTFDVRKDPSNKRLLELINKTNQFNLNGTRLAEGEWMRRLADPSGVAVAVSYEDKFGPLGIIGVVAGTRVGRTLDITTWVLSCRAFSRRIEHHTLKHLFEFYDVDSIVLAEAPTERNEPLQQFIRAVSATVDQAGRPIVARDAFFSAGHAFPHRAAVREQSPDQDTAAIPSAVV